MVYEKSELHPDGLYFEEQFEDVLNEGNTFLAPSILFEKQEELELDNKEVFYIIKYLFFYNKSRFSIQDTELGYHVNPMTILRVRNSLESKGYLKHDRSMDSKGRIGTHYDFTGLIEKIKSIK